MRRLPALILFLSSVVAASCGGSDRGSPPAVPDAGPGPCTPSCSGRSCGPDGCGGSCGTCSPDQSCVEATGTCACAPETDRAFCERAQVTCGTAAGTDNCGRQRAAACDLCTAPQSCDPVARTCVCVPETNGQFCRRKNVACGPLEAQDNCDAPRSVDCGGCARASTCDAHGQCVCTAESDADFCDRLGKRCGPATGRDNCGQPRRVESCGQCGPMSGCDVRTAQCLPCEDDAAFCARNGHRCGSLIALDNCGLLRTVEDCGSCTPPRECRTDGHCAVPGRPYNDDCLDPAAIQFDNSGRATLKVDTTGATDSGDASCFQGQGNDVVFAFTLSDPSALEATASGIGGVAPVLVLRRPCDSVNGELACATGAVALPATIRLELLPAGTYYLWIDANSDGAPGGTYDVALAVTEPTPEPVNNLCATAELLSFTGGSATVMATTRGASDETTGSCGDMPGADVVYAFSIARPSSVEAQLTSLAAEFVPGLYIADGCGATAHQVGCATDVRGLALLSLASLAPGDYYLIVDGATAGRGDFTLEVALGAPIANDTCLTAQPLVFDPVSHTAFAQSNTRTAADDALGSCAYPGGADLVFSFDIPPGPHQNVEVTVTPDVNAGLLPVVYARSGCDQPSTELGCAMRLLSGPATLRLRDLAAGHYYLFVDSIAGVAGRFALRAVTSDVQPPPANDLCVSATPLTLGATPVTVAGATAHATNDSSGGCGVMNGADVIYAVTLNAPSALVAKVTPSSTGYAPAVYIRGGCAATAVEVACGTFDEWAGAALATAPSLAAGTWEVVIDGTDGSEGAFTLELTAAMPFDNFTCTAAQPLVVDPATHAVTVFADTRLGPDSTASGCAPIGSGHEVFYSFTVPAGASKDATVEVTPLRGSALVADVSVRGDCGRRSAEVVCSPPGSTAPLLARNLGEGTWFIVVEGALTNADGPFTLKLTLDDAALPPANEDCGSVVDLPVDPTTGIARVYGNLVAARDDFAPACAWSSGPDVVYHLHLDRSKQVEVTLAAPTGSSLVPLLALYSGCGGSAAELGCNESWFTGTPALMVFPRLAAGDYYLVVDSDAPWSTGPFDLLVELKPPASPPANNACSAATQIGFDATGVARATGDTTSAADASSSYCTTVAAPLSGGELVYRLDLAASASITARVTRAAGNTLYAPAVSVRIGCAPADEVACGVGNPAMGQVSTTVSVPAGPVYLFVDGAAGAMTGNAFGPFTLEVSKASAVPGDGCGNPGLFPLDPATGRGTVTADLTNALDSGDGSCAPQSGADLVYRLVLAQESTVRISALPASISSHATPTVYLRRTCGDPLSEMGCSNGTVDEMTSDVSFLVRRVPAGTWFLWVDARVPTGVGPVTVTVETSEPAAPPPANDGCLAATPVALDPTVHRTVRLQGDTTWATNDFAGRCGEGVAVESGPDLAYQVTLAQDATLVAVVQHERSSPSFRPAIHLRAGCGSTDDLACDGTAFMPSAGFARALPRGTWLLVVDGQQGSAGAFVLDLVARPTAAPTYDGCPGAEPIALDANGFGRAAGVISASTLNDDSGSCVPRQGADVVFRFTTQATQDVALELLPGTAFTAAMYLRSACGDPATEKACTWDMRLDTRPRLALSRLPAGTWFVWVGALGAPRDSVFTLTVQASDPPPPAAHDRCRGAQPLVFDSTGIAAVSDDTATGLDDYAGSCATPDEPLDGPDLVYSFSLSGPAAVTAIVTPAATDPNFRPAVYLRQACESAAASDEVLCAAPARYLLGSAPARGTVTLPRGDYYAIVDGLGGTFGHFSLELRRNLAVPGDSCLVPVDLVPDGSGVARFSGDTRAAANSTEGTCTYGAAPDLVYGLTLGEEQTLDVEITPATGSLLAPSVYLRRLCQDASAANELLCAKSTQRGAALRARVPRLAAGHYALWIDGSLGSDAGAFSATATLSAPSAAPANDACAGATPLVFTGSIARVAGETWFAHDDAHPSCDPGVGPDVVYAFTLGAPQEVAVRVTADASSPLFRPVVSVRSACDPAVANDLAELTCAGVDLRAATAGPATALATINNLPRGTWYLWIDGAQPTHEETPGAFTLEVTLNPPSAGPANESCPAAQPLSFASGTRLQVSGSTVGARSEAAGSCDGGAASGAAGDVVYTFTTTREQKISARVVPSVGFAPMVYLRRACGSTATSDEAACALQLAAGTPVTAVAAHAPAGTYWLWVDGASDAPSARAGTFSLEVTLDAPVYAPANDRCAGAIALTRGVAVAGDTTEAQADYGDWDTPPDACGALAYWPRGREVVYRYTPTTDGSFTIALTAGAGFDPLLWYGSGFCGESYACRGIADEGGPGDGENLTVRGVAGTPYFIYVDAWSTTQDAYGTFTLVVQ